MSVLVRRWTLSVRRWMLACQSAKLQDSAWNSQHPNQIMRITVTDYLDVVSSWCFWSEPTWAELKRRYGGRVEFQWKIALMDPKGLPTSREQEQWFYRRSGMMMRSPFMLNTDWYDPSLPEWLAPNCVAEAARALASSMTAFASRCLTPRCVRGKKSVIGGSRPRSVRQPARLTRKSCSSARGRPRSRSAFGHRQRNFMRSRSRNARHS